MAKDPAFLFYSSDFLNGIADLTMEERGQYITLLCLQHQKGEITDKTIRLCVGSVSVDVLDKFTKLKNGSYINERLQEEIEKRQNFTESRRNNGKKGGRPKKASGLAKLNLMENENINENEDINKKEKVKNFSNEVYECYDKCIYYFDGLVPEDNTEWLKTIDKLNTKDHLSFDDILLIVKSARGDSFWSKNFLSLAKLRRKDKDNIPYWRVFVEKFKKEKTKTEKMYNAYEEAKISMGL